MGSDLPLRILFVVPYTPDQIRTRPYNLIRSLAAAGHEVTVATLWTSPEERSAANRLKSEVWEVHLERMHSVRSLWNCIKALPGRNPIQTHYSWNPGLAKRLAELVQTKQFDVVHVEHLRGARYALLLAELLSKSKQPAAPVVWDAVDCISRLFRYAARDSHTARSRIVAKLELRRTEHCEGWLTSRFARVVVTSEGDRDELLRLGRQSRLASGSNATDSLTERISVIPNGVDLDYFSASQQSREQHRLVISGKMSYHANVTGVVRFVNEVMPRIWAKLPETRLWIVGKDPPGSIRRLGVPWRQGNQNRQNGGDPRIEITGTVADIRPFLQKSTVAIAPIQYGVGIQNKVLEAFAIGTPLVATPQAVSALDIQSGREAIVARTDEGFAVGVLTLLEKAEYRGSIASAARTYVEERHSWGAIARKLTQVYGEARCATA